MEAITNPGSPPAAPLTDAERDQLADCLAVVEAYRNAGLELARALRTARRDRLYREDHGSFEAFVLASDLQFDVRRAQQLIAAVDRIDEMAEAGVEDLPRNEAQVRPLTALTVSEAVEVWQAALAEHGSARALSRSTVERTCDHVLGLHAEAERDDHDALEQGAPEQDAGRGRDAGPDYTAAMAEAGDAPYGDDARAALARVPAADRDTVREMLSTLADQVTAGVVEEAAAVARAERAENGGRSGRPVVVGAAVVVVEANRRRLTEGAARQVIRTLDVLPDPDDAGRNGVAETDDEGPDAEAGDYVPDPAEATLPLLVVIPVPLCPGSLLDAYDGARASVVGRREVVVTVSELEHHGGPVQGGVVDVRAVREAAIEVGITKTFNMTGALVGWARYSANPLTGCSHACSVRFCYASDLALRFYPQAFVPTIHPARLDAFANTPLPDPDDFAPCERAWCRSVFLGSMGDVMNHSFPNWWIQAVIDEIAAHPDWHVFVLTKLAARLGGFEWPNNAMIGVTVTSQREVRAAAAGLAAVTTGGGKWISAEPMLGPIDPTALLGAGATFFAIGGQSPTRWDREEKQPDPAWVRNFMIAVWARGGYVFSKHNLDWIGHIPFPGTDPFQSAPLPGALIERTAGAPAPDRKPVMARGPQA